MRSNRSVRVACFAALIGSAVQSCFTLFQIGRFFLLPYLPRPTFTAIRTSGWLSVTPWICFGVALISLQAVTHDRPRREGWLGTLLAVVGIVSILTTIVGFLALTPSRDCFPGLLCDPYTTTTGAALRILWDLGVVGTVFLCCGFVLLGIAAPRNHHVPRRSVVLLALGVFALYAYTALPTPVAFPEWLFHVSGSAILLGLAWTTCWLILTIDVFSARQPHMA